MVKVVKPKSALVSAPPPLTVVYCDVILNVAHAVDSKWIVDSGCDEGLSIIKMFVEPNYIYLHSGFVDFRENINGLLVIIEHELELSQSNDAIFIFCNKKYDRLKIVYWDKTGLVLWYKVLQKLRFKRPKLDDLKHIKLSEQQLHWLLGGFDVIGYRTLDYTSTGL